VAADFIRRKLLKRRASYSLETVMSSPEKAALLEHAQSLRHRVFLCYSATDDPTINIPRVKARVRPGGHDVPEDKILSRYPRSLELLLPAVKPTHLAYPFDKSRHGGARLGVADIPHGAELVLRCDPTPLWFLKAMGEKITSPP
jgi:predicted ABC-type ATPase